MTTINLNLTFKLHRLPVKIQSVLECTQLPKAFFTLLKSDTAF